MKIVFPSTHLSIWLSGVFFIARFIFFGGVAAAQDFSDIYDFNIEKPNQVDGLGPEGALVLGDDGNLYGVTVSGGPANTGTFFRITPDGALTTLCQIGSAYGLVKAPDGTFYGYGIDGYSVVHFTPDGSCSTIARLPGNFGKATSGATPMVTPDGTFYGTGANVVYTVTPAGSVTVLHTFTLATEGSGPKGLVQASDGTLYGANLYDGPNGLGTFFRISPDGAFSVIAPFPITVQNPNPDGTYPRLGAPQGPLVMGGDGNLYGAAEDWGSNVGFAIFRLNTSGEMVNLVPVGPQYFKSPPAAGTYSPQIGIPATALIVGSDGNFYGTTWVSDAGTIFQLTPGGTLTILYQLQKDGGNPSALVQTPDGAFYGTNSGPGPFGSIFTLGGGGGGTGPTTPSITDLTLVDPVPTLVNASSVAQNPAGLVIDPNLLAANGRTVVGVAADGVSRVLLRGVTTSTLDFSLLDENMNPVAQPDLYGSLASATGSGFGFSSVVAVQPVNSNGQSMAFVVYKAPLDFVRSDPNYQSSDTMSASRKVFIQIATPAGTTLATVPVVIVRPPVVLVHGFVSEPRFWNTFTPLVASCFAPTVSADPRFYLQCADYSNVAPGVQSIQPDYAFTGSTFLGSFPAVKANTLGFAYNAPAVFGQFQNTLEHYSQSAPQASNMPIASVQVDVVGHSMGGLITRMMPFVLASSPTNFRQVANYDQGIVHKLITLGSPHLGSGLSIAALDPANSCSWFGSAMSGEYSLISATIAGYPQPVSGGAEDLVGDGLGFCASTALATLQGPADKQIPVALIAGEMSDSQLSGFATGTPALKVLALSVAAQTFGACPNDYAMTSYNPAGWLRLTRTYAASQSDAIVPVTSAFDGLDADSACALNAKSPPCHLTFVPGAVHGDGTVTELGFPPPDLLQPITEVPLQVINLLNTSVRDPAFAPLPSNSFNQVGNCK